MEKTIAITYCPLEIGIEEALKIVVKDDEYLNNAINITREKKTGEGVEIFSQNHNMIITEEGYYFAFYVKELEKI